MEQIGKEIYNEVVKEIPNLISEDYGSPFSIENLNKMIKKIDRWGRKCDNLFKSNKRGISAFKNYRSGIKGVETATVKDFKDATERSSVLDLFKEGFHLATTIRKVLTGEKNRLRVLFEGTDKISGVKQLFQIEIDESDLFDKEKKISEIIQITSDTNMSSINAHFSLTLNKTHIQDLQNLSHRSRRVDQIQLDSNSQIIFNYIFQKDKNMKKQGRTLDQGRMLEAFYEIVKKKNVVGEIENGILSKQQENNINNYIEQHYRQDSLWGVRQVGDMSMVNENGNLSQIQLKAFVDGNTEANFGGLPSVITQLNRVKRLLEELQKDATPQEKAKKIKEAFYHQGQGEGAEIKIQEYIENSIKNIEEKVIDEIVEKINP